MTNASRLALVSATMAAISPVPRLRPTAVPGVAAATLTALLDRRRGGFEEFERAAALLLGTRHAVVVGSARAGMAAVLAHAGCRPGDEVVVPSYTAPCVPGFLRARGFRVRVAAVCPRRLVVTGETLAAALGPHTRAVIPTHVEGVTAPMGEIAAALPPGVVMVEDAAHAVGAEVDGQPVGAQRRRRGAQLRQGQARQHHVRRLGGHRRRGGGRRDARRPRRAATSDPTAPAERDGDRARRGRGDAPAPLPARRSTR